MLTDAEILALCCFKEANLEPPDGIAAVARVILNRTAQKYESDGTIWGTITHRNQFSWVNYDFVNGKYVMVAFTPAQVATRITKLYAEAQEFPHALGRCEDISTSVVEREWNGSPEFQKLGTRALLYDNLDISHPVWATPDKLITKIGRHSFFAAS